jgi:protein TonB
MFADLLRHSCPSTVSASSRGDRRFTFGGCLALSLVLHVTALSVFTLFRTYTGHVPRKTVVIEIDLSRIEAANLGKSSSLPAPVSKSKAAAPPRPGPRTSAIRTARPFSGRASRGEPVALPPEPGPVKETETNTAEAGAGGSLSGTAPSASGSGVPGTQSGGRGEEGRHPSGGGKEPGQALADYSRTVRALIERHKEYPLAARKLGIHGTVVVCFSLNRHGELCGVSVAKSSGNTMLDNAGMRAVRNVGTFPPPPSHAVQGEALSFRIPITFALTTG